MNERRIVKLNQNESKIFQLLRDCVKETKLPVTLRVAGGWVRDKVRISISISISVRYQYLIIIQSYFHLLLVTWIR